MEHIALFEEQVSLTPNDFSKEIPSIKNLLLLKLKDKLENRCSKHGYVVGDSLKIISQSMGKSTNGRFTGDYQFYVQVQGTVINPPEGATIEGEVIRKNKMGIYMNFRNAIRVIVPRDLHIGNEEFENVTIGDIIRVEIKKSRFQINDESILSVGIFLENTNKKVSAAESDIKQESSNISEEDES
jgi:DNA-directed RNA polymerase subunit E'/Rpb7